MADCSQSTSSHKSGWAVPYKFATYATTAWTTQRKQLTSTKYRSFLLAELRKESKPNSTADILTLCGQN